MSIDFDLLNYCSIYGTTRVVPTFLGDDTTTQTVILTGSLAAGGYATFSVYFEYGCPYDPAVPGTVDSNGVFGATYIPLPSFSAYVSSSTSPNTAGRWFEVGNSPRPLTCPSSAGNLNLNIYTLMGTATSSNPTLYIVNFEVSNPYGVTATITDQPITVVGYGFSNS